MNDLFASGRSAIVSECGKFRYRLDREVSASGSTFAFFGVNPSTADANIDDATVRKWTGFVKRWGGSRFIVGNVFAFRATDVRELATASEPIGPHNDRFIHEICGEADILIPCWGNRSKSPKHWRYRFNFMLDLMRDTGKPVRVFGFTNSGDPLHPLMLSYDTPMVPLTHPDSLANAA